MNAKTILGTGLALATATTIAIAGGVLTPTKSAANSVASPLASVRVVNADGRDLRVYAMSPAGLHLLGTVNSNESTGFRLPDDFATADNDVVLVATHMDSHQTYVSQNLNITAGDLVQWKVKGEPGRIDATTFHKAPLATPHRTHPHP